LANGFDALSSSLIDSNVSLRRKHRKSKELRHAAWFATLWGKWTCWSSEMVIRKSDKHQLFTRTCTIQTSWLMCNLSTFGVRTSHGQIRTHKTHHGPNLGEATTFPLIVYFVPGHRANTQMTFCLEIPKIGILETLEAHNFVWRRPIEVRFKAKL